ncbi:peptide-methionine (S)-S-oxide reductase [Pedobacter sp. GR22-6]|uniref:peptide-methionine (S)-S-oxide reductase n=1 Tax=Pedobacter sp. GR22-6 TaxID=3127957 RepID=UPI00307EFFD7
MINKIGFGGSCHWCTEAIFLSLKETLDVQQGWIAPDNDPDSFSEAVIVQYDPEVITMDTLIAIHLHTHSCTSAHGMRAKYRSSVYTFDQAQFELSSQILLELQPDFSAPIITQVLKFSDFKLNKAEYLNYYYSNPEKPFCENIVNPKLRELIKRFSQQVDLDKMAHL